MSGRSLASKAELGSSTVARMLKGGDIEVTAYVAMCHALGLVAADLMREAERHAALLDWDLAADATTELTDFERFDASLSDDPA